MTKPNKPERSFTSVVPSSRARMNYDEYFYLKICNKQNTERIYSDCSVVCLITDTKNVYVKGNKFRDYSECSDEDISQIIE